MYIVMRRRWLPFMQCVSLKLYCFTIQCVWSSSWSFQKSGIIQHYVHSHYRLHIAGIPPGYDWLQCMWCLSWQFLKLVSPTSFVVEIALDECNTSVNMKPTLSITAAKQWIPACISSKCAVVNIFICSSVEMLHFRDSTLCTRNREDLLSDTKVVYHWSLEKAVFCIIACK